MGCDQSQSHDKRPDKTRDARDKSQRTTTPNVVRPLASAAALHLLLASLAVPISTYSSTVSSVYASSQPLSSPPSGLTAPYQYDYYLLVTYDLLLGALSRGKGLCRLVLSARPDHWQGSGNAYCAW